VVLDHSGQKLAYVYFEEEPGRRSAAKLLERDEAPAYQCKWYPLAAQSPNNHTPTVAAKPSATATSARNFSISCMELLMHGDPLARTLFGGKSAETTHGTIWLLYLHSPHAAFSNGRHRKMRAARTLDTSRPPTLSPSQAVHPHPYHWGTAPVAPR
jgi:hypothetical protein